MGLGSHGALGTSFTYVPLCSDWLAWALCQPDRRLLSWQAWPGWIADSPGMLRADADIAQLAAGLPQLRSLRLYNLAGVTGAGLHALSDLKSLVRLPGD